MALWHRKTPRTGGARRRRSKPAPPFPEFPYHPDPRRHGLDRRVGAAVRALRPPLRLRLHRPGVRRRRLRRRPAVPVVHRRRLRGAAAADRVHRRRRRTSPDDVPGRVLDEIAERTPGFNGWQQEHWLYHCADGAAFIGHAPRRRGRPRTASAAAIAASASRTPTLRRTVRALRAAPSGTTIRRSDRPGPFGPLETSSKSANFRAISSSFSMTATTQHPGRERPPSGHAPGTDPSNTHLAAI